MEPIDAVITWVNGDDPGFRAKLSQYRSDLNPHPRSIDDTRFRESGEIYLCIASIRSFLPFIRKIHLVTDDQVPMQLPALLDALDISGNYVELVDHRIIFRGHEDCLPTFNSESIETMLHRIPGLSERFIYFNDDFFVARPLDRTCFFDHGLPVVRARKRFFHDDRPDKRFGQFWDRHFKTWKIGRPSFLVAQQKAARAVGGFRRYYHINHQPNPMRKSVLEKFFGEHPELLADQVQHRFRHPEQLSTTNLANHLEIKNHGVRPRGYAPALYLDLDRLDPGELRAKFARGVETGAYWGCLQSLDEASSEVRAELLRLLRTHLGEVMDKLPPSLLTANSVS